MSSATDQLFLFDHPVSSYAQKVRMALRFKNLPFTKQTPHDLGSGQPNAAFATANPRMEVPALVDGDFAVFDSTTIVMYLEDKFPEPRLLPADARARAEARMLDDVCGTQYEATNWAYGEIKWFERARGDEARRLTKRVAQQTRQFQAWLTERLGDTDFFHGATPGYADFAVAPVLNRSVVYGFGPAEGSPLQHWHQRISAVPCVQETFAEMLEASQQLSAAGASMWKPHGSRKREYRDHRLEWMVKNGGIGIVLQGLEDDNIRFSWPHPEEEEEEEEEEGE